MSKENAQRDDLNLVIKIVDGQLTHIQRVVPVGNTLDVTHIYELGDCTQMEKEFLLSLKALLNGPL